MLRTLSATIVFVACTSLGQAQSFFDSFDDGDCQDGNPVTWTEGEGTFDCSTGSLVLTPPVVPGIGASAFVENINYEDVLIEMTFEYPAPNDQFVTSLFRNQFGNNMTDFYYAGIFPDGELFIGYFEGNGQGTIAVGGEFLPNRPIGAEEDVTLLVEMIGATITMQAWLTADGPSQSATLTWTDPLNRYPTGDSIGLGFNPRGDFSPIVFHSFGLTQIPEPSSGWLMMVTFCLAFRQLRRCGRSRI